MAKIIGNTTATPNPRPDWNQTDETKADYIKNKPTIVTNISDESSDTEVPSAKAVYEYISNDVVNNDDFEAVFQDFSDNLDLNYYTKTEIDSRFGNYVDDIADKIDKNLELLGGEVDE